MASSGRSLAPSSGLPDLGEKLDRYYRSYSSAPQQLKPVASFIATIIAIAALGFGLPFMMLYIDLSRDPTVMRAEANLTAALDALKTAKAQQSTLNLPEFLDNQAKLMGDQTIVLAELEKKIPKPDWIGSAMKYMGLIGGLVAAIAGLSTTILGWRAERRATARFMVELREYVTRLEKERSPIVTP